MDMFKKKDYGGKSAKTFIVKTQRLFKDIKVRRSIIYVISCNSYLTDKNQSKLNEFREAYPEFTVLQEEGATGIDLMYQFSLKDNLTMVVGKQALLYQCLNSTTTFFHLLNNKVNIYDYHLCRAKKFISIQGLKDYKVFSKLFDYPTIFKILRELPEMDNETMFEYLSNEYNRELNKDILSNNINKYCLKTRYENRCIQ